MEKIKYFFLVQSINNLTGEKFLTLQNDFFEKYCGIFSFDEENKLEYTDIFTAYVSKILL